MRTDFNEDLIIRQLHQLSENESRTILELLSSLNSSEQVSLEEKTQISLCHYKSLNVKSGVPWSCLCGWGSISECPSQVSTYSFTKGSTGSHTSHNSIHSCEQLYRINGHPTASAGRLALSPSVSVSDDNNIIRQADGDSSLLHTHRVLLNNWKFRFIFTSFGLLPAARIPLNC